MKKYLYIDLCKQWKMSMAYLKKTNPLNNIDLTFFERENMKKVIVMLAVAACVSACASRQPEPQVVAPAQNVQPARRACPVKAAQPAAPVQQQGCNSCGSHSYTVSEPVEVVYKNVTYTTVYEPKTYSNTTYVKKPYSCPNGNLCAQKAPAPMAPEQRK